MNRRTLMIALTAALVSLGLGYGLLGLAAPDAGADAPVAAGTLDLAALANAYTGPDGVPPRIVVVDEPAAATAEVARHDDDRYDDDRYDDDRYDDDHDDHDDHDDDDDDDRDDRDGHDDDD